ncbi:NADH:flavin oxidoreductase/NADH oxidase [Arthrobacter sp. 9V]|uniref:NADH:flavin oxidoreductase/NADH oxidase n=1 Tax=Arthrobacter sp. 9V TaxID=2653132 RepID=UPI00135910F5|nr:NADH:flavin oxidoreductase/NADH oxidase [Arthrobacter sp. 9V]
MSNLFRPLRLRGLEIPNRVWMAPMCMYSALPEGPEAGVPTDFHLTHLVSRAFGGAGLVMVEATAVRLDGRISPWDLGLWNDKQERAFARIANALSAHGTVPAIQLAHAGRKASVAKPWVSSGPVQKPDGGWTSVGPSPEAYEGLPAPEELTKNDIEQLVSDFYRSAQRAARAGFQVAEVHGAHGYLLHSFLSPASNKRTDSYGGSFENRLRFPLQVVDAVRDAWPDDLPVFFRASATDWLSENPREERIGWTSEDTVRLARELQSHGVDLLDVSSGGVVRDALIPSEPGYQVGFSAKARTEVGVPTAAVGLITDPHQAAAILHNGQADAVFLGRELLRNPYWPQHAARTLGVEPVWPEPYAYVV